MSKSVSKSTKKQSITELEKQIAKLEKENASLKKEQKNNPQNRGRLIRKISSVALIILSSLFIVSSVIFVWLQRTIVDTDVWTENTAQIIETESIRNDVSNKITSELFAQVDVEALVQDALPERAAPLSGPIASGIEGFVGEQTNKILSSDKFAEVWIEANRQSHESFINSIERLNTINSENNSDDTIYIVDDQLMLNLRPILDEVKADLIARGLTFIPQENKIPNEKLTFEIAQIENLPQILAAYNALNSLSYWTPVLAVLLGGAGIYVANNRRKAFVGLIILTLALTVSTVQVIKFGQFAFTEGATANAEALSVESATAIYQIFANSLITSLRWLMSALFVIGGFMFLTGKSSSAVWVRRKFGYLLKNYKSNGFVKYVAEHASTIVGTIAVLTAGLLVLIDFTTPTPQLILIFIGGLLIFVIYIIKQEVES